VSRILLDTHLLLWAVAEPNKLPAGAQAKTEPLVLLTNDAILAGYGDCVELAAPKPRRPRP